MKKNFILYSLILIFTLTSSAFAMSFGSYNKDEDYGLLDGLKFNWSKKDKSQKFIDVREPEKKEHKQLIKDIGEDVYLRNLIENRSIIYDLFFILYFLIPLGL